MVILVRLKYRVHVNTPSQICVLTPSPESIYIVSIFLSSILSDDPSDLRRVSVSLVAHPQCMHAMSTLHPNCNKNNACSVLSLPPSYTCSRIPNYKAQTWPTSNKLTTHHTYVLRPLAPLHSFPHSFPSCISAGILTLSMPSGILPSTTANAPRSATSASLPVSNATLEMTSAGSNRCQ